MHANQPSGLESGSPFEFIDNSMKCVGAGFSLSRGCFGLKVDVTGRHRSIVDIDEDRNIQVQWTVLSAF